MGRESEEHSENAKEQDKNQTSIGRMQSDGRSETGIIKILTVLEVLEHYIVFRDRGYAP